MNHSILIIGGGNMGGAIARALHATSEFSVSIVETDEARRQVFSVMGIPCFATLAETPKTDSVLLAIKPQQFAAYAEGMNAALPGTAPLIISIMAGIPLAALQRISPRAVRVMPNLPAMIHESMSVLCAPTLDAASRHIAQTIFATIGATAWVEEEEQLHAVTAISGSGPGYVFAFMEALMEAATQHGLPTELARQLVTQTVRGASMLADQSTADAATLRAQVTSKGGTTEAALETLAESGFQHLIARAVSAAVDRSRALAE